MNNDTFNVTDVICVFQFLTCFLIEVDNLNVSAAQHFVALPTFLANQAETQFRTNISGG